MDFNILLSIRIRGSKKPSREEPSIQLVETVGWVTLADRLYIYIVISVCRHELNESVCNIRALYSMKRTVYLVILVKPFIVRSIRTKALSLILFFSLNVSQTALMP